jgi:hypothetical protein
MTHFSRQHDKHVSAYYDHILEQIMESLGVTWPMLTADLTDWYACGDDLI